MILIERDVQQIVVAFRKLTTIHYILCVSKDNMSLMNEKIKGTTSHTFFWEAYRMESILRFIYGEINAKISQISTMNSTQPKPKFEMPNTVSCYRQQCRVCDLFDLCFCFFLLSVIVVCKKLLLFAMYCVSMLKSRNLQMTFCRHDAQSVKHVGVDAKKNCVD